VNHHKILYAKGENRGANLRQIFGDEFAAERSVMPVSFSASQSLMMQ